MQRFSSSGELVDRSSELGRNNTSHIDVVAAATGITSFEKLRRTLVRNSGARPNELQWLKTQNDAMFRFKER
jgi:hypothetical protein